MSSGKKAGLLAAFVAASAMSLPKAAWAQSGGAMMRVAGGHAPATPLHPNFVSLPQVPGLGFDYSHLAAVGGRTNNFSGGWGHRSATPIFTGILPFYSVMENGPSYAEPQPQPSVIVVQQPPQTMVVQLSAPQNSATELPASPARVSSVAPIPDLGEFIFLRRDGQVILAVAFTTTHERLTYITRDGAKRSFPFAELDKDATLQINEANGTTLVLPD